MKKQNVINLLAAGALAVAMVFSVQSCKKDDPDPCENVTCSGNGTCSDGNCACDDGYEGTNCEDAFNEKFIGSWNGIGCGFTETFTVSASSDPKKFIITSSTNWFDCDGGGTYDEPISVVATINSDGTGFTVPTVTDRCSATISQSGNGSISGDILTFNYNAIIPGFPALGCNFSLNRQ